MRVCRFHKPRSGTVATARLTRGQQDRGVGDGHAAPRCSRNRPTAGRRHDRFVKKDQCGARIIEQPDSSRDADSLSIRPTGNPGRVAALRAFKRARRLPILSVVFLASWPAAHQPKSGLTRTTIRRGGLLAQRSQRSLRQRGCVSPLDRGGGSQRVWELLIRQPERDRRATAGSGHHPRGRKHVRQPRPVMVVVQLIHL